MLWSGNPKMCSVSATQQSNQLNKIPLDIHLNWNYGRNKHKTSDNPPLRSQTVFAKPHPNMSYRTRRYANPW